MLKAISLREDYQRVRGAFLRVHFVQELFKQQILLQLFLSIGKSDEPAYPGGIKWDVLRKVKTAGKKEFLEVGQYGVCN